MEKFEVIERRGENKVLIEAVANKNRFLLDMKEKSIEVINKLLSVDDLDFILHLRIELGWFNM